MGTRCCILFSSRYGAPFTVYYRHLDGYPEVTGKELVELLKATVDLDEYKAEKKIIEGLSYKTEKYGPLLNGGLEKILKTVQADLEWVYVLGNMSGPGDRRSLTIYKTAPSWGAAYQPFIWRVWGSYVQFFEEIMKTGVDDWMAKIDLTASSQLSMLEAYLRVQAKLQEVVA